MWAQAEFPPDSFWQQTPRHFQLAMRGVRKRIRNESEDRIRHAWNTGAFSAAAGVGKLKPLSAYLGKGPQRQTPQEMLTVLRMFQSRGAKMKIKRVKLDKAA